MIQPRMNRPPGYPRLAIAAGTCDPDRTILVCDDERHIVRLIQVNLERAGFKVLTAFDGKEGLEIIRREKPDLTVLDVMMPFLSGLDVLKIVRDDPENDVMPIILLSAKSQDKDIFDGYHLGADMVLTKPFNPLELVSMVGGVDNR